MRSLVVVVAAVVIVTGGGIAGATGDGRDNCEVLCRRNNQVSKK